ncbi:MAG TPA: ATP-grasp domain-containing protein [Verrucomicrobiae bacterium]|nr:ATP-grasp domain-containing protein [Verrucomicrobiae bacterium]
MKPTVLVATTCHWFSSARLSMALTSAGFSVEAICPPYHPLHKTSAVRKTYTYQGLTPQMSFADAIASAKPDLILPGDDLATRHLQQLYERGKRKGKAGAAVCSLIERSIGPAECFPFMSSRSGFIQLAEKEGVRVPKMEIIANQADLHNWIGRHGLPAVLKSNGSSGGEGVRIVRTQEEADRAFVKLHAPPLLARAAKHVFIDHDMTLVWPCLLRRRPVLNAQQFVSGHEATSLIACWQGAVLGGLHFEVINKSEASGPATVMRWIESAEMQSACKKIAARLNLSGLHGFDFMLEDGTGNPYMIEWNPRATQVGHLLLGTGRDLPAGLFAAVTGTVIQEAPPLTENNTIALFPQEWLRNPSSSYLESAYHDVPWEEPELTRECIRKPRKWSDLYSKKKLSRVLSEVRLPRL